MVNTFLVYSDVYLSAKCLDNLRLNKQITEAITIYKIIMKLKLLGNYYKVLIPDNYQLYDWIRQVVTLYKKEDVTFVFKSNGNLIKYSKDIKLIQQKYTERVI